MIQKSFDAIDKSDIDVLITNGVNESKTLEYKQELPGNYNTPQKLDQGLRWICRLDR